MLEMGQSSDLDLFKQSVKMHALSSVMASDALATVSAVKAKPTITGCLPSETLSTGSLGGDRGLKSSWIQRLKPRDEVDMISSSYAEASSEKPQSHGYPEGKAFLKSLDVTIDEAGTKILKNGSMSRQVVHGQKDFLSEKGLGLGPWINLSSGSWLDPKALLESEPAEANLVHVVGGGIATGSDTEAEGRARGNVNASLVSNNFTSSGLQPDVVMPVNKAKPPLPPRNKLGLPPRPNQKSQGLTALSGNSSPTAGDKVRFLKYNSHAKVNEKPLQWELAVEVVSPSKVGVNEDVSDDHAVSSSQGTRPPTFQRHGSRLFPVKELFLNSTVGGLHPELPSKHHEHAMSGTADCGACPHLKTAMGPSVSCGDGQVGSGRKEVSVCTDTILRGRFPSLEGINDTIVVPLSEVAVIDLQPERSRSQAEGSKAVFERTDKACALQRLPSEPSHRGTKGDRTDPVLEPASSSSTTASFPWEMFIEAIGASKVAREQFVETYNKARDELKSHKSLHMVYRASEKEVDYHSKLTLGQGFYGCDHAALRLERQSLGSQHLLSGGHVEFSNSRLDQKSEPSGINSKAIGTSPPKKEQLKFERGTVQLIDGNSGASTIGDFQNQGTFSGFPLRSTCDLKIPVLDHTALKRAQISPIEPHSKASVQSEHGDRRKEIYFQGDLRNKPSRSGGVVYHEGHDYSNNVAVKHQELENLHTMHGVSQSKNLAHFSEAGNRVNDSQNQALLSLGKRSRGVFEEVTSSENLSSKANKAATAQRDISTCRANVWLQRWHPTIHINKGARGHESIQSDGVGTESMKCFHLGTNKSEGGNVCGLADMGTGTRTEKNAFSQLNKKGQILEHINAHSAKKLPSAAAMAIVGTAARQFCSTQPQRKGSFAFWSGFGMTSMQNEDALKDKGKGKLEDKGKGKLD